MNKSKKAVFFDIDGTIWDREMNIPKSTKEGIKKLRENGVYTFLSSGRTRVFIHEEKLLNLGFDGILAGCGTHVEFEDEIILHESIEPDMVKESLQILKKYHMPVVLEGKDYLYADEKDMEKDPFIGELKKSLGEKLQWIGDHDMKWEINKFSATIVNDDFTKALEEMSPWYDYMVHGKRVVECIPKGFNKGTGIQVICEKLGILQENTYAFGDSVNDLDMLKYVAHGIAMGDGMEEAKEVADFVTSDLHKDGIYRGLEHFGLI